MKRVALIFIFAFISVNLVSSVFAFDWNPINIVKEAFGKKVSENKDVKNNAKITGHAVKAPKQQKTKTCPAGKILRTVCTKSIPSKCSSSCEKISTSTTSAKCYYNPCPPVLVDGRWQHCDALPNLISCSDSTCNQGPCTNKASITGNAVKEKKVKKPKCGNRLCETGEMKRDVTHELSNKELKSKEYNTSPFCVKDCGYNVRGV